MTLFPFTRITAFVTTAGAALSHVEGDVLRYLLFFLILAAAVLACRAQAAAHHAVASAYSPESSGSTNGCDGSRLHDRDLTFASLIVPCGARVRFCVRGRCVTAVRRDSGPYVAGRLFDLNLGVVRALGFRSCVAFGVREIEWSRV